MEDCVATGAYESIDNLPQASSNRRNSHGSNITSSSMDYNEVYTRNIAETRQQQNEYQMLQRNNPGVQHENRASDAYKLQSRLNKVEHDDIRVVTKKMRRSLIITVSVNMVMLLFVVAVSIGLSAQSYSQSMSGESINAANDDILSLQMEIANLQTQLNCGAGQWHRVAYLNMSEPSQQCPSAWREYNTSRVRACGRSISSDQSCSSTFYSTTLKYSRVCGRVIGYQFGSPDGFEEGNQNNTDGIELTLGASNRHIWSFVAGVTESSSTHSRSNCPCSTSNDDASGPPSFIGDNYYCESGNPTFDFTNQLYTRDKLWDGQQCEDTCCTGSKSPPWFSVQLPIRTNEVIKVSICGDESTENEDTPVELLEIMVQ